MIEIQKGVPITETRGFGPKPMGEVSKAMLSMAVGDSIWLPKKTDAGRVKYAKKVKPGIKFASRREGDGVRVWRIE